MVVEEENRNGEWRGDSDGNCCSIWSHVVFKFKSQFTPDRLARYHTTENNADQLFQAMPYLQLRRWSKSMGRKVTMGEGHRNMENGE